MPTLFCSLQAEHLQHGHLPASRPPSTNAAVRAGISNLLVVLAMLLGTSAKAQFISADSLRGNIIPLMDRRYIDQRLDLSPRIQPWPYLERFEAASALCDRQGNLVADAVHDRVHLLLAQSTPEFVWPEPGMKANWSNQQGVLLLPVEGAEDSMDILASWYKGLNPDLSTNQGYGYARISLSSTYGSIMLRDLRPSQSALGEKLAVVRHANGKDWWVISHEIVGDKFVIWRLNRNGISLSNEQSCGRPIRSDKGAPAIGALRFSYDGKQLYHSAIQGFYDVFNFDRNLGVLTLIDSIFSSNTSYIFDVGELGSKLRYLGFFYSAWTNQYTIYVRIYSSHKYLGSLISIPNFSLYPNFTTFAVSGDRVLFSCDSNLSTRLLLEVHATGDSFEVVHEYTWPKGGVLPATLPLMPNYRLGVLPTAPTPTTWPTPGIETPTNALILPNVITPNGDGLNDTWQWSTYQQASGGCAVHIYNRWGLEVYAAGSYQGGFTGEGLVPGTYFYVVQCADGTTRKGPLEVLR